MNNYQKNKLKIVFKSSPVFLENDKESIQAWNERSLESMLIFCKLYRNEEGVYGIGYVILFEDGWEYGSFHENLGKAKDFREACLKGIYEILLHAKEESASRIFLLSENKAFLGHLNESDIKSKKALRDLYDSFDEVIFSGIGNIDIENIDRLRDFAFSKAKSATEFRTRRKRFQITLLASEKEESATEQKRRLEDLVELMTEIHHKYMTRPPEEKISSCEKEIRELENNIDEEPDYEEKQSQLISELEIYKEEKIKIDMLREDFEKKKVEAEEKRKAEEERRKKILEKRGFCIQCGNKIEKEWKFCPFCSAKSTTSK